MSKLGLWKYKKVCTARKQIALGVSLLFYVNSKQKINIFKDGTSWGVAVIRIHIDMIC